jgi:hypothetical protein
MTKMTKLETWVHLAGYDVVAEIVRDLYWERAPGMTEEEILRDLKKRHEVIYQR